MACALVKAVTWRLLVLLLVASDAALDLGIYGPITSISQDTLAMAVAFDLDFRKNTDASLVTRFGPPIVTIPSLHADLDLTVSIGTSNSDPNIGIATAVDMFQGTGYRQVEGLVGGYHSAISMPVNTLATYYKVTQVSWGSTNAALSQKATYPYFLRTIPPDSIQGGGMWRFIKHFSVPMVSFIYAQEPYGEGMFQVVSTAASADSESFRINPIGIDYMPTTYDAEVARAKIRSAMSALPKFIMLTFTTDQGRGFFPVAAEEGLLGSSYQLVGSEALGLGTDAANIPNGYMHFSPMSRGPLFTTFDSMWQAMTVEDCTGAAATTRYQLDLLKVDLADGVAANLSAATFASASTLSMEAPFVFDAAYAFVIAANKLLNEGTALADIRGETLLDAVRSVSFEGISGDVLFDSNGDRLAAYFIVNIQAGSEVQAARFDSATDQIVMLPGVQLLWTEGSSGGTVPSALVACSSGWYKDADLLCKLCPSGLVTNAAGDGCEECPFGLVAVEVGGGRQCEHYPIQLGVYGPITSMANEYLAAAVAFDLDFRKNFDASLVSRFGPPIVTIPNLKGELRVKLQIATSNSNPEMGVGSTLAMFQGSGGRDAIVGLVGGYHSAISMPVASLATQYQVPQVSFGSTSPKLSSKAEYPWFLRTIPPDSIQGGGMWRFIKQFLVPAVSFIYAQESYGEGLFQTVSNLAGVAGESFRVTAVGIQYMPVAYDEDLARETCQRVRGMSSKTIFFGMTTDQGRKFYPIAQAEGLLSSAFQSVGSEALPATAGLGGYVPLGYMWLSPLSRGALFPQFAAMWQQLTPEDVTGAAATERYGLDLFAVNLTEGSTGPITAATFANMDSFPLEAPYLFDACYSFVAAANELLRQQTAPAQIRGEALLDAVRAVHFEGISGAVSFNADGDRAASYYIGNWQQSSGGGNVAVDAALYDSVTGTIAVVSGESLVWVDGQAGVKVPDTLTACKPGFYQDAFLMCQQCSEGLVTTADKTGCEACPFGMVAVEDEARGRFCEYFPVQIGVYGPITSMSMEYLGAAVAFDLDFRKNFDASLVSRFGPPIVAVPNLRSELRIKLQIGTSDSNPDIGVATNLEFFQGQNGRDAIVGLVGGYHSAISMPVASLATQYKVPQVSFGSTSPKLSNKETYPFFLRTIPPDSIQGGGMWKLVETFGIPAITFLYAQESYGEGLFQTVTDQASQNEQAFRVQSVGIKYMPSSYDAEEARTKIQRALGMSAKVFFLAMTTDQGKGFFPVAQAQGMLSAQYQVVGSEALPYSQMPQAPLGYMWLSPMSRGSLFSNFTMLWTKLTPEDVRGDEATAAYGLDRFKVGLDSARLPAPSAATFASLDNFPLEAPFLFDAAYCFAFAANSMMNRGVAVSDIRGDALLAEVKAVEFEGISGFVKFNAEGDRLASYYIENVQRAPAAGRRLAGEQLVVTRPALYSAASGQILPAGAELTWMTGELAAAVPDALTACAPGHVPDENGICQKCAPGMFSLGGSSRTCEKCPAGTKANAALGATGCSSCPIGSTAAEEASTSCTVCPPGSFSAVEGGVSCTKCALGSYQAAAGRSECSACGANMNTQFLAAESRDDCQCEAGFFRDTRSDPQAACQPCLEGLSCPFGSDLRHYWAWEQAGRPSARGAFPLVEASHMSLASEPLSVFKCNIARKCPGGPPGTCGESLDSSVRSCALCQEKFFWNGERCAECDFLETSSILFPALPILMAPVVIGLLYKVSRDDSELWGTWRNGLASIGFLLLNHYQITTLVNNANLQYSGQIVDILSFFSFTEDPSTIFKPQCAGFQDFQQTTVMKSVGPIAIALLILLTALGSHVVKALTKRDVGFEKNRTLNVYFSLIFTFFAGISAMALTMFKCASNPNGIDTLSKDQSVICGSSDWWSMVGVAIVAVVLYIFGFGGLFTWAVVVAPRRFNDQAFRRRWKFLFIKFRPDVWWWALVICGKGVLMNVGYTFLRLGIAQIYWVMFCIAVYTGACVYFMPWRHRLSNALDIYTNKALLFVCSLLAFYVNGAPEGLKDIERSIAVAVTCINLSPLVVGCGIVGKMVYDQLHPAPRQRRMKELKKLCPSLQLFASAPESELASFMDRVDEWGRFYITSALHVISTEFGGASHKARLSDGKLKSSSSVEAIKDLSTEAAAPAAVTVYI